MPPARQREYFLYADFLRGLSERPFQNDSNGH